MLPVGSLDAVERLPGYLPATSSVHYTTSCNTQSSDPVDGRNHRPTHVELIGIINKSLLLHLVGCLYYCTLSQCSFTFLVLFSFKVYQLLNIFPLPIFCRQKACYITFHTNYETDLISFISRQEGHDEIND